MRIAITVDPEIPVPPKFYGGIERIVDMLVRGLVARGHEVTLIAHPDSQVSCRLLTYPALHSQGVSNVARNLGYVSWQLCNGHYDVVHSFARLAYLLPILPLRLPKVMSYQRPISPRSICVGELMSRGTLHFTGCSAHVIRPWASRRNFHVVYNGVPLERYHATEWVSGDAPLTYLGRVEEIKGVHLALEVAMKSRRRLIIAGNIPEAEQYRRYFKEQIQPHVDGRAVEYVGAVDDAAKNQLLGISAALLMPLLWDEPFGIVMAEALACGTPVIGLRRGSLPEIVQHGVNGFVCGSVEEMVTAIDRLPDIDRRDCRRIVEEKFSDRVIVEAYEQLYREVVKGRETA
ncbi:MAG: glycosyltransferase family 4 protein [Acidobacteriia bacterium]|nr:glycosyltransferase family 4 protein [Terriglobia bacterium]